MNDGDTTTDDAAREFYYLQKRIGPCKSVEAAREVARSQRLKPFRVKVVYQKPIFTEAWEDPANTMTITLWGKSMVEAVTHAGLSWTR